MSKTVNDILLIKKYQAGELDARAMHELERRALDDTFLADALEGYGHAGGDQQKNLADLSARLRSRTDKKVRLLTLRMQLSIAASLLVIMGIGAWLVIRNQNAKHEEPKQVAVNVQQAPKREQPTVSAPAQPARQTADTTAKQKTLASTRFTAPAVLSTKADVETNQPRPLADIQPKKDSIKSNDFAANGTAPANGYSSTDANKVVAKEVAPQFKSNPNANDAIVQSLNANKAAARKYKSMVPETLLNAHADNLNIKPLLRGNNNTLVGYVSGNNQPLEGAIVKMSGADFGVVTDANGRFVLHNVPDNKNLVVKSLGFATKQLKVNGGDSINVSLEPNVSALADVAVAAPSPANSNNDKSPGSPVVRPAAGWKALLDYLDKNSVSPDGETGKVILSFSVDGKGALSGFKIVRSLSTAADQKAIDLIKNGPAWAGTADGQPHEVKIPVNFH